VRHWVVLKAVFVKTLIEMRRYIFNTISGLITMYIVFLLLFYGAKTVGGAAFQTGDSLEGLVVGYMVWMLALLAYGDLAWGISMEAEIGTLEQLYLSPAGFSWVNVSWLIARSVVNLVFLGLILLVMMLTTGQWLNLDLVSLVPLVLLTMLAPYGFGFMMAGLALVFKRIQSAFQILQFVFVAFVAVPITPAGHGEPPSQAGYGRRDPPVGAARRRTRSGRRGRGRLLPPRPRRLQLLRERGQRPGAHGAVLGKRPENAGSPSRAGSQPGTSAAGPSPTTCYAEQMERLHRRALSFGGGARLPSRFRPP